MSVGAIGAGAGRTAAAIEVEPQRTSVARGELRAAIDRAHREVTGRAASAELLDVLSAHASLETGGGDRMYNYNFGGIKGRGPSGETARCRTKEVVGGREIAIRDGFRAYRSLDEGAVDYVRLMRTRFGAAVARAEAGDVDGFAHALKQAQYYTADESKYASALRAFGGPTTATAPRAQLADRAPFVDAVALDRVLGAVACHPLRAPERRPEEEDV